MLFSPKWEEQRLEPQPPLHKIINVPLPTQQATKILRDLQARCNSSNKPTQLKALQCWDAWMSQINSQDWQAISFCQFAIKPLLTKKIHPLHKDSDICKIKLYIMWKLIQSVQTNVIADGPKYILENFMQSSFTWLSSIEHIENAVSVLILKLILALFQRSDEAILCDNFIFSSVRINSSVLKELFHKFVDKFLNIFDYWTKVQNNSLILSLWTLFLEKCEELQSSITTPIWHRIFKANQAFCSEKNEDVRDRLLFLHACATKIKTVLSSSKYIGGESCFMTPCEALFRKLSEICKMENLNSISPDLESANLFQICQDICQTLACKSIEICDYDLCIQLLDSLEDFSLKSFFWGAWCGFIESFKSTLLSTEISSFEKKEMIFYRKLRGPTVNFELDKEYLNENCVAVVYSNIKALKIGCFCTAESSNSTPVGEAASPINTRCLVKMEPIDALIFNDINVKCESEIDIADDFPSQELVPVSNDRFEIGSFNSEVKTKRVTLNIDFKKLGHFGIRPFEVKRLVTLSNFSFIKFGPIERTLISFNAECFKNSPNVILNMLSARFDGSDMHLDPNERYLCYRENDLPVEGIDRQKKEIQAKKERSTPRSAPKRRSQLPSAQKNNSGSDEVNVTPKTRSQTKLAMAKAMATETAAKEETVITKKSRKSFEVRIQEILQKNRKRKKAGKSDDNEEYGETKKMVLRKRSTISPSKMKNQKKENSSKEDIGKRRDEGKKKKETFLKEEEKSSRTSADGKLENFFKIINPASTKKHKSNDLGSSKCETLNGKSKKGKKEILNWRQKSLKTVMKDKVEGKGLSLKEVERLETNSGVPQIISHSQNQGPNYNFSVIPKGHKYAKIPRESSPVLLENNSVPEAFKKRAKKAMGPKKLSKSDVENIDPELVEPEVTDAPVTETPENIEYNEVIIETPSFRSESTETKENFFSELEMYLEEKEDLTQEYMIDISQKAEIPENTELAIAEKETSDDETSISTGEKCEIANAEGSSAPHTETKSSKKRGFPELLETESYEIETKKLKFTNDDGIAIINEEVAEVTKEEKASVDGIKGRKSESSPSPKTLKMVNRSPTCSRASRMIALIPESKFAVSNHVKMDSPTQQQHQQQQQQSSPKVESKDRNRKFSGTDRNSRVSKMLARLNKRTAKEEEESLEEDKWPCEINGATTTTMTTPNRDPLAAKTVSPKSSGKKRKLLGFDESKNQTVIYRIDTPPSLVLEEWESIKEEYLNCQAAEEDLLLTPPSRKYPPSRKSRNKLFAPEMDSAPLLDHPDP